MNPYLPATPPKVQTHQEPPSIYLPGIGHMPNPLYRPQTAQAPTALPSAPKAPTAPQAPQNWAPGVDTTQTNPSDDLRGKTITPGPMADRNAIAQTYENNWNSATAPQFQADLRGATSQAAGAGQLGSGQLRTSLGNLAYNRDVNRNAQEGNFMNQALEGSIGDAYRNVGIAQQQQQYQTGLQKQTFDQALQALQAGNSGNPADAQFAISNLYGNQANNSNSGLAGLINNNQPQTQAPIAPQPTPPYNPNSPNPFAPGNYGIGSGGLYNPSSWITGGR